MNTEESSQSLHVFATIFNVDLMITKENEKDTLSLRMDW